jgi:hypothetical protein
VGPVRPIKVRVETRGDGVAGVGEDLADRVKRIARRIKAALRQARKARLNHGQS